MGNQKKGRKRRRKKRIKKIVLAFEILVILVLISAAALFLIPGAKVKFLKAFLGCSPGRSLVGCVLGDDYEKYIQDTEFNENNIVQNTGLTISGEYTNIALFGGDSRSGELGESAHGDSMIILSIHNKTGDVKMVSVYRDTVLKYTVNGEANYNKATSALYFGGTVAAVNMMNENLDLNITDYVIVNFAGLANIVDALGGIDVTITEEEREYTNGYLGETREVTGMITPNVEVSGTVHLTGLQATAYSRIRQVPFHDEDGTTLTDDYGRTARQRLVLMQILKQAKSAGIDELMNVAKTLFSQNSGEDKFILSSMSFDKVLKLLPVALDCEIIGNQGFPTDFTSVKIDGSDCLAVRGLIYNVGKLHEYLFGQEGYEPTSEVTEINDKLIKITGVKPAG